MRHAVADRAVLLLAFLGAHAMAATPASAPAKFARAEAIYTAVPADLKPGEVEWKPEKREEANAWLRNNVVDVPIQIQGKVKSVFFEADSFAVELEPETSKVGGNRVSLGVNQTVTIPGTMKDYGSKLRRGSTMRASGKIVRAEVSGAGEETGKIRQITLDVAMIVTEPAK